MEVLTNQEIVNRALTGIMEQKALAKQDYNCFYYDKTTGNRCALGLCFTVEQAKALQSKYPGTNILGFNNTDTECVENIDFASRVQREHDGASSYLEAMQSIIELATKYGLNVPQEARDHISAHAE